MELMGGVWVILIWITKYKFNQGCDANSEKLHEINVDEKKTSWKINKILMNVDVEKKKTAWRQCIKILMNVDVEKKKTAWR